MRIVCALIVATLLAACSRDSCLRDRCEVVRACHRLAFTCDPPGTLYAGSVKDAPAGVRLARGEGADDDLLLSNGGVTIVLDAIASPHDLAPTGGNLIDFGLAGGADDMNIVYQIAGILPDDAFAYDSLDIVDHSPDYVAAIVQGHLSGRPDVKVLTRYELDPCDPGVRVRSELFNGTADTQAWVVADVPHWGKRRIVPFAPRPDEGYLQPQLDLLQLDSLYDHFDYDGAAATADDSPGYSVAACDQEDVEGINDIELSALGTARQVVRPGDTVVYERFWSVAGAGQGPAPAIADSLQVREQLDGTTAPIGVTGRIVAAGAGFGGDVRRADVEIDAGDTPLTTVVPAADGTFAVAVPAGTGYTYQVASFGRTVASGAVPAGGAIGDVAIDAPGTLEVTVEKDGAPTYAQVVLVPADDATRANVTGNFHGRFGDCAPWLGPPHGGSPSCNRILVEPAGNDAEVPAGSYLAYATVGPEATLGKQAVTITAGNTQTLDFALTSLAIAPPGWLSADLHVHGRASFDSSIPDHDRVLSFAAASVQVIAATDHDYVRDYADQVTQLGIGDRVRVMGGVETTQLIPWMKVPDDDFPRVIGHFNFWPITPMPSAARGGAPWDELVEPGELFDRMDPLIGADGVRMLNHPWADPQAGRDLGYLRAIKFDPRIAIPDAADGSRNGMLLRTPGNRHRNLDWDVIEIGNGASLVEPIRARVLWWSLISQGFVAAGAANSDSHGLNDASLGWDRNYVETGGDLAAFDATTFDRAVKAGHMVGGTGIFLDVTIRNASGTVVRTVGLDPYVPSPGDTVHVEARAAPWIPVTEIRVITSQGERVVASSPGTGVVARVADVPVSELVGSKDDWFLVEAGMPLPDYEDLDDDGVPDTGDNNGDGVVDDRDIEPGDDSGPLDSPADPTDPSDPRYDLTRVVPGAFPYAFTSPILVDLAGDGWTPPGLP